MTESVVPRTETVLGLVRRWAESGYDQGCDILPILADALEEAGYSDARVLRCFRDREGAGHVSVGPFREALAGVPPELAGHNWAEAFAYAGEVGEADDGYGYALSGSPNVSKAAPHLPDVSEADFGRADVSRVVAASEGVRDEDNWVCVGELRDGRFFALSAGCDYTGWD